MKILYWLFPGWRVTNQKLITCKYSSLLCLNREWGKDEVVIVETSRDGRKRAFFVSENGRRAIDYNYICAHLGEIL